ncbi:polymeric immunoglobulin receptor-like [Cololabis saira]|uniref:polymeric immunoglobulin receptor-like n=1 Tax=Cololabis saira TaxID=129043 RepID=UPI002AD5283B|nr:polymeric immunoglobulin receptor-like [Cololabis saira]
MRSLQHQLFFLSISLIFATSAQGVQLFGYEGTDVKVSCPYDQGYEDYEKYLCNKACAWEDVLIITSQTNKTKYSIYDDKKSRIFTTTISDLRPADAGAHWCGVSRNAKDIYTERNLKILPDSCCDNVVEIQSYEDGSVSISCPYESIDSSYLKYICRGTQPSVCLQQALITSESSQDTKFKLIDDFRSSNFTVRISSLALEDSGSYLCGVHRNTGLDVFSAVKLQVKEWCCVKTQTMRGTVGGSLTLYCPYPPQHHGNKKFLCRGSQRRACERVESRSRFTLQAGSSNSFQVTISKLEADHEKQTPTVATSTSPLIRKESTHPADGPDKDAAGYVVYVVPAVLLALFILIVIVYKQKCRKDQGAKVANSNKAMEQHMQEATHAEEIYENHDAVIKSIKSSPKTQNVRYHHDGADEEQPDYENFIITEELYSNEFYPKANKR